MAWFCLLVAGLLEVVWAYSMKQSQGFSRPVPAIVTVVTMLASFWMLAIAMRTLPLSTSYTIWTGIGAVGGFLVGWLVLAEPVNAMKVGGAVLIVLGLVLVKLAGT
jgi:quaternary ammonium compound-resistance protein SugE